MNVFASSFNMPPGCFVSDIPGWDEPPLYPVIRCGACGCWIAESRVIDQEIHYDHYECPGAKVFSDGDVGLCGGYCIDPHTVEEYAGITTWYRCRHCGADTSIQEF